MGHNSNDNFLEAHKVPEKLNLGLHIKSIMLLGQWKKNLKFSNFMFIQLSAVTSNVVVKPSFQSHKAMKTNAYFILLYSNIGHWQSGRGKMGKLGQNINMQPHLYDPLWDPGFIKFQQEFFFVPWIGEQQYTEMLFWQFSNIII